MAFTAGSAAQIVVADAVNNLGGSTRVSPDIQEDRRFTILHINRILQAAGGAWNTVGFFEHNRAAIHANRFVRP